VVTEHTSAFWWNCPTCLEDRLRRAEEEAYEQDKAQAHYEQDKAQAHEAKRVAQFAKDQLEVLKEKA
jgi:hypothetical protein